MKGSNGSARIAACYCLHDDHYFLAESIASLKGLVDVHAFISKKPWNGIPGNWQRCKEVAKAAGAKVALGEWTDEQTQRQTALAQLRDLGYHHALTPDGDEFLDESLLNTLLKIANGDIADRVHVHMDTYWKTAEYVIRPREAITPVMLISLDRAHQVFIRHYEGGRPLILGPEFGVMHHLSYVGPDERIERKLETWSHKAEVQPNWLDNIWRAWDEDKLMRNLHPTHPPAYGFAERIHTPQLLEKLRPAEPQLDSPKPQDWPSISVVIPLYGNPDDISLCLASLDRCRDLIHEVIVVDNASTDGAREVAERYSMVKLIKNDSNLGFAKASNQGLEVATGEVVIFLNSDTVVPRIGLIRLIESLLSSGTIGAVGPYTNECGHSQRLDPTYTSLETLDLFAEDFAERTVEDADAPADMLVGFCLAVRKRVLDEVGGFDESFGVGSFEDNDLCYRIRRAGYKLIISSRSWVHHFGSRTFGRMNHNPFKILADNEVKFKAKWKEDIESGFASHLPGFVNSQVVFDGNKTPAKRAAAIKPMVKQADISLCMIVRNEERVLADCLKSAKPFFKQIVVVDTGSTDRTIEIAREHGAQVHEIVWPDSFSEARNESIKCAKGKWIFWMDADDTLPWHCGEAVLQAALTAPEGVGGFIVPVQFVDDVPGSGTRVDHVKLFRNLTGVRFEGRIHEQNIESLRQAGREIERSSAYVLHSGYDTTPEGQARKRLRDEKLLQLDLAERPNHPFVLFNIGMTAHYLGEHEKAIEWLDRSLAVAEPGESHLRKVYALKAISLHALGRTGEALSTVTRGLQEVGEDPELRFRAGIICAEQKRFEEAKQHYLAINEDISGHYSAIDIGMLGPKRFFNLAGVCEQMGDYAGARQWWLKALEVNPLFLPSAMELFSSAVRVGDFRTAQQMLDHMRQYVGASEDWAKMAADYHSAAGGPQAAEFFLRNAVATYPRHIGPRLVLARQLLGEGRDREAYEHLVALAQMGSAEGAFYLGVSANRRGDLGEALAWMERALILNPGHEATKQQVEHLRAAVVAESS